MQEIQRLRIGEPSRVAVAKRHVSDWGRHLGARCDVEHHSTSLLGASVPDPFRPKITVHEVGNVPIQLDESLRQFLAQAPEDPTDVLVEPRLDDL